jgi:hypothetical protein
MCVPHPAKAVSSNGFAKEKKKPKHIQRVSQDQFEKGDPNFIDERTSVCEPEKKASFLDKLVKGL